MDNDIKDLQSLWQQQKSKPMDMDKIIDDLNEMEKKSKKERIFMLSIFPMTIVLLIFFLPIFKSPFYMASIIILTLAMLMIIFLVFRNKFEKADNHQEITNKDFLDNQIRKLKDKKKITSVYMWLYSFLIVLGVNVGYIEAFNDLELLIRIIIHFSVSIVLFVFMFWSINKRKVKNEKEIEPLIEQLSVISDQLSVTN